MARARTSGLVRISVLLLQIKKTWSFSVFSLLLLYKTIRVSWFCGVTLIPRTERKLSSNSSEGLREKRFCSCRRPLLRETLTKLNAWPQPNILVTRYSSRVKENEHAVLRHTRGGTQKYFSDSSGERLNTDSVDNQRVCGSTDESCSYRDVASHVEMPIYGEMFRENLVAIPGTTQLVGGLIQHEEVKK